MRIALPARSSTQLVFPPICTVLGPGVGMLPRTPQKVICISARGYRAYLGCRKEGYFLSVPACPSQRSHKSERPNPPRCAIVVLGCRVRLDADGVALGALGRRLDAGAAAYARHGDERTVVVVSGGARWGRNVEADVMARELARKGVPEAAIVRERCSMSTRENARFTAAALARRGVAQALIVTCPWHMPRALALFGRSGIEAYPVAANRGEDASWGRRLWRWAREQVLTYALFGLCACSKSGH